MQLYVKNGVVLAWHDDDQSVPASAYGEGVAILPYAGPIADLVVGEAPPAIDLLAYAAARRYAIETGGIVVAGAPVATDRGSQAMIANALAYVQASGAASVSYKSPAGFVTLAADQIKAVALAVGAHVQACFATEDAVDAGINASPATITSLAQVDAIFAALSTVVTSAPASAATGSPAPATAA